MISLTFFFCYYFNGGQCIESSNFFFFTHSMCLRILEKLLPLFQKFFSILFCWILNDTHILVLLNWILSSSGNFSSFYQFYIQVDLTFHSNLFFFIKTLILNHKAFCYTEFCRFRVMILMSFQRCFKDAESNFVVFVLKCCGVMLYLNYEAKYFFL